MADRITDSPARCGLGLFAKAWDPGAVKTRLAKTLGNQAAADIYFRLLVFHLSRFADTADIRSVVYSPNDDAIRKRFASLLTGPTASWSLTPQVQSDLGARMGTFFQQQFSESGEAMNRVVVIGSDAPQLSPDAIQHAFLLLEDNDVVFGPSTDGGYYLIGLSVMDDTIFQGVDWSTDKVLQQSLEKCDLAGLSVAQLESLTDIDEEVDLLRVIESLKGSGDSDCIDLAEDLETIIEGTRQ